MDVDSQQTQGGWESFSIRTYNTILVLAVTIGGMVIAMIFAWTASIAEQATSRSTNASLALSSLDHLGDRLDIILTSSDLTIASGQTYSLKWAADQLKLLQAEVSESGGRDDLLAFFLRPREFEAILNDLGVVLDTSTTLSQTGEDLIARYDGRAAAAVAHFQEVFSALSTETQERERVALTLADRGNLIRVSSVASYFALCVFLGWLGVRRVVVPLEVLTRANERYDVSELESDEINRAPEEIKSLASALKMYVNNLHLIVAERTLELDLEKQALENEVGMRRAAEQDLSEALIRAEQASESKSKFLSVTSHELRTPLNTMIIALNLLDDEQQSKQARSWLRSAVDSGGHLSRLIDRILQFSGIELEVHELNPTEVNLAVFCRSLIEQVRLQFEASQMSFRANCAVEEDALATFDTGAVQQITNNFVSNAIRYASAANVTLDIKTTELSGHQYSLSISLADDGCGISAEEVEELFDPFYRKDGSLSRANEGLGLGLALSKSLAELLGGTCSVETEVGSGSKFTLIFPLALRQDSAPNVEDESEEIAIAPLLEGQILLVEDSEVNQMITRHLLEKMGFDVECASSGKEALQLAAGQRFNVILMDLQMPEMDGLEATRHLKISEGLNRATPVIALTANVGKEMRLAVEQCGMQGFVSKPVSPEVLGEEIARVLAA
jgi:signal transduction histidine kinase